MARLIDADELDFLSVMDDQDRLCEVCRFRYDCHGLSMGPNGPTYPACADGDYEIFVDLDALEELMQEDKDNA